MKILRTSALTLLSSAVWILGIASPRPAFSATPSGQNMRALLDEAKKTEYERKVAAKQTELERLSEDLRKGQQQIEGLETSVQKVGAAVTEATRQLDQLMAQRKQSSRELELVNLRIDAEKFKAEGLKLLETANKKSMEALARKNEETDLKSAIVAAEVRQFAAKAPLDPVASGPGTRNPKGEVSLSDLRKKLEKAERATYSANSIAREAMSAASLRLQQAEAAAAKADKKQEEASLEKNPSFPGGNDPLKP